MSWVLGVALLAAQQVGSFQMTPPVGYRSAKPSSDAVLVRVGGVAIRASDAESYLWDWAAQPVVQDLVSYQIVAGEAKKRGVSVKDADVVKAVNEQLAQYKTQLGPTADVEKALRERGYSKSRLFVVIKSDLLLEAIVAKNLKPEKFVKVATIVIRPKSEQLSDLSEAIQLAQSAYDRLGKGESWHTVLTEVVKDENAKRGDGLLGWRGTDAFPKATQTELETLGVGGLTKPVQTTFGIQIFRVLAVGKGASGADLAELKQQYFGTARPALLEELKKKVKVEWVR